MKKTRGTVTPAKPMLQMSLSFVDKSVWVCPFCCGVLCFEGGRGKKVSEVWAENRVGGQTMSEIRMVGIPLSEWFKRYEKLEELLQFAITDLESIADCEMCANFNSCKYHHDYRSERAKNFTVHCTDCYQWRHTDRYEKLKGV